MPDRADDWGGAARFMLSWALHFYASGHEAAGDSHLRTAIVNLREAVRAARREGAYD